jgi:hypothetical protein
MNWEKASVISACNSGSNFGRALVSWVRMIGIWYGFSVTWEPRVNLDCNSCSKRIVSLSGPPTLFDWMNSLRQEIGLQKGYVLVLFASRLLVLVCSRRPTSPSGRGFWRDLLETAGCIIVRKVERKCGRAHLVYSVLNKFWRILQIIKCVEVGEYWKSEANGREFFQLG